MRLALVVALLAVAALGQEAGSSSLGNQFPDAPEPIKHDAAGNWVHDKAGDPPRWYQHTFTRKWDAAHGIMLAATVYDIEVTHAGVAHHNCVEQNGDLPRHPSRGELYESNMVPIVIVTVFDLLVQSRHLPRGWAWMGYMGAGYGTFVHVQGGTTWLARCW